MPIDTATALLGTIGAPFAARFLVAWTVELRLRGLVYGANLEPRRRRPDYPPPNDPIRSLVVVIIATAIGWPIATVLASLFSPATATAAFLVSAIVSSGYALLRIRGDDRRTRELLSARLVNQHRGTLPDA